MAVQEMRRVFVMGSARLADPNPEASPEEVRDSYAVNYPHLSTCNIEGPELKDCELHFSFIPPPVKTKG